VTRAAGNAEGKFLAGIIPEVPQVLDWYAEGLIHGDAGPKRTGFASKLLHPMIQVRAHSDDRPVRTGVPGIDRPSGGLFTHSVTCSAVLTARMMCAWATILNVGPRNTRKVRRLTGPRRGDGWSGFGGNSISHFLRRELVTTRSNAGAEKEGEFAGEFRSVSLGTERPRVRSAIPTRACKISPRASVKPGASDAFANLA
jgi:hypothetical protein